MERFAREAVVVNAVIACATHLIGVDFVKSVPEAKINCALSMSLA